MPMPPHTPGPWRIERDGWEGQYIHGKDDRVPCGDRFIADVSLYFDGAEANARLIAAAPDMLKALKEAGIRLDVSKSLSDNSFARQIKSIIARAEGKA